MASRPPQQWLMDRIQGQSKYGERERPPFPCCWVPPPVGWCPSLLETNVFCRCWGWLGISNSEFIRFWCLNIAFLLNLCSMLMTAYACLAISDDFFVLTKAAFQELVVTNADMDVGMEQKPIFGFVGIRAAALDNPVSGVGQVVVRFEQFCDIKDEGLERYIDPKDCNDCQDVSTNMIIAMMVSVVTFLPAFFAVQLRMYSGYDVNCVKLYLTVLGIITLLLNASVIVSYTTICGPSFYNGLVLYDNQGNVLTPGTPDDVVSLRLHFDWSWGYGFLILVVATSLKFVDVLFNACVPTPNVTRDRKEQEIYESIGAQSMQAMMIQEAPSPTPGGNADTPTKQQVLPSPENQPQYEQTRYIQEVQQQPFLQQQQEDYYEEVEEQEEEIEEEFYYDSGRAQSYPADPSIAHSAQQDQQDPSLSVWNGLHSLPGDPSVAFPDGPSFAP